MENEYYRLISEYNENLERYGKNSVSRAIENINNKIIKPALQESGKNVLQDLLTQLGKTTNTKINEKYSDTIKNKY